MRKDEHRMDKTTISYTSANFAFGMMWGGEVDRKLSVLETEDVRLAVNKAYRDMIQHNIPGLGLKKIADSKCKGNKQDQKKKIFDLKSERINALKLTVATQVIQVFKTGKLTHEDLCIAFVDSFKNIIRELNKAIVLFEKPEAQISEEAITYGLAQKIINMTFKYLYLFDDKDGYEEIFKQCHMPLDSYILDYLRSDDEWKIKAIKNSDKWSKLTKEDYDRISQAIQEKCNEKSGDLQYPLFAEFYIWPRALARATKKELSEG